MTENELGQTRISPAESFDISRLVEYSKDSIVSRILEKGKAGNITAFAFDEGQELSEHTAPFNAYVQVIDGEARLVIGGKDVIVSGGEIALMPADTPHAVYAEKRFKMLLIMFKVIR